jgi:tRNA (mo5U34)-methyltransferase
MGAADGFFSFEFERRGAARVVAADYDAGYPDVPFHEVERFGQGELPGGLHRFELAKRLLGSKVEHRNQNIYTLSPDEIGTFDFVFCGSVLLHLTDPLLALRALRRVTAGHAVIATAYYHEPLLSVYERVVGLGMRLRKRKTKIKFSALVQNEMDDSVWIPTVAGLVNLVERAGFRAVRVHAKFNIERTGQRRGWPHAVLHASV